MRIGLFIDDYLPRVHGVASSTINFKRALEEKGHTVFIVAPSEPDYVDEETNVIRVPSFEPLIFNKAKARVGLFYPGLAKKLAKYQFDIVHSQTQFSMGILANEVAKQLYIPHISTMHTVYAELLDQYKWAVYSGTAILSVVYPIYFKSMPKMELPRDLSRPSELLKEQIWKVINIFLNNTDGVIAPSQHVARSMRHYGLTVPCHTIPNGMNREYFRGLTTSPLPKGIEKKPGDTWLLSVGRISGEKRTDMLVRALALVDNPKLKLVIVGDGVAMPELRALVEELGVQERVTFAGKQPQPAVAALMGQSDMFAIVSYNFDNQPMVILEAITAGLPVVYCDPKLKEGLTKKNALLARNPEAEAIADAIATLADNPEMRREMARASLELSNDFDITSLAEKLLAIYQKAIKKKQRSANAARVIAGEPSPK